VGPLCQPPLDLGGQVHGVPIDDEEDQAGGVPEEAQEAMMEMATNLSWAFRFLDGPVKPRKLR
jgi:hypothetical protein